MMATCDRYFSLVFGLDVGKYPGNGFIQIICWVTATAVEDRCHLLDHIYAQRSLKETNITIGNIVFANFDFLSSETG